jgi:hypothetical protein
MRQLHVPKSELPKANYSDKEHPFIEFHSRGTAQTCYRVFVSSPEILFLAVIGSLRRR